MSHFDSLPKLLGTHYFYQYGKDVSYGFPPPVSRGFDPLRKTYSNFKLSSGVPQELVVHMFQA